METFNKFGHGEIYTIEEIINTEGKLGKLMVYCTSAACLSVTTDMLSWASNKPNHNKVVFVGKNNPSNNNIIIILGCQISDLAILNNIRLAEKLHAENQRATVYMGGCIAYRFDIKLPKFIHRLSVTRSKYAEINKEWSSRINWERPFWISEQNWREKDIALSEGHLFRGMYPLQIGAGGSNSCSCSDIEEMRGEKYETDAFLQVNEFLSHNDIVLVSDNPSIKQIKDWCYLSMRYGKQISIRNIAPCVAVNCSEELTELALNKLLRIFHCTIHSNEVEVLQSMGREVESTLKSIELMKKLRELGVITATNVTIHYEVDTGVYNQLPNMIVLAHKRFYANYPIEWLKETFDYHSWNTYFQGKWDRESAEERFELYIK